MSKNKKISENPLVLTTGETRNRCLPPSTMYPPHLVQNWGEVHYGGDNIGGKIHCRIAVGEIMLSVKFKKHTFLHHNNGQTRGLCEQKNLSYYAFFDRNCFVALVVPPYLDPPYKELVRRPRK